MSDIEWVEVTPEDVNSMIPMIARGEDRPFTEIRVQAPGMANNGVVSLVWSNCIPVIHAFGVDISIQHMVRDHGWRAWVPRDYSEFKMDDVAFTKDWRVAIRDGKGIWRLSNGHQHAMAGDAEIRDEIRKYGGRVLRHDERNPHRPVTIFEVVKD